MNWNEYIEIGPKYVPKVKKGRKINVKQFGISKVVIVRTKSNGGIPHWCQERWRSERKLPMVSKFLR